MPTEQALIESLTPLLGPSPGRRYPVGVGDDGAVRRCGSNERLVLTTDALVEGTHFSLDYMRLEEVGFKAMAANVSDCAAMAARPDGALIEVVFPAGRNRTRDIRALYRGIHQACEQWDFPVVGGNLTRGPCWVISVTMLGTVGAKQRPLLRSTMRHGDSVWVSGWPGRSAAGLAALRRWGRSAIPRRFRGLVASHLRPQPSVDNAVRLARSRAVHAAMDISDGTGKECTTLSARAGLGIVLERSTFPIAEAMYALGKVLNIHPLEWFLAGGEDYELVFTASRSFDPVKVLGDGARGAFTRIGRVERGLEGVWMLDEAGKRVPVSHGHGWDHLR
jgi:thiamine-monophosphate kinase